MTNGQVMTNGSSVSSTTSTKPGIFWMKVSSYVTALRPWSFSASLVPVLLGSALAWQQGSFNIVILLLTALSVLSVHGAGNLINTFYDYVKGIDSKKSDDRTLVDQLLSKDEVVTLGAMLYGFGCLSFVGLVTLSPARTEHLALVFFGGLSSSFLYTGGPAGFKYIALGDVVILLLFGPISVLFSYLAQTGQTAWFTMYYAIPLALNTEAILHSNNTRDMAVDRQARIVTLAILLGPAAAIVLYAILLFLPYIAFVVLSLHFSKWLLLPLITLPAAFRLEKEFRSASMQKVPQKTAKLNFSFGLLFVAAVCLAQKSQLPFL